LDELGSGILQNPKPATIARSPEKMLTARYHEMDFKTAAEHRADAAAVCLSAVALNAGIARIVLMTVFLASDRSAYTSGVIVTIDGAR
jgi:hypothetical protein